MNYYERIQKSINSIPACNILVTVQTLKQTRITSIPLGHIQDILPRPCQ